jgi:hypothetical protein
MRRNIALGVYMPLWMTALKKWLLQVRFLIVCSMIYLISRNSFVNDYAWCLAGANCHRHWINGKCAFPWVWEMQHGDVVRFLHLASRTTLSVWFVSYAITFVDFQSRSLFLYSFFSCRFRHSHFSSDLIAHGAADPSTLPLPYVHSLFSLMVYFIVKYDFTNSGSNGVFIHLFSIFLWLIS